MGRKRKKTKGGGAKQRAKLKNKVRGLLDSRPNNSYSETQIIQRLGFRDNYINSELPYIISELTDDGAIKELPDGRFQSTHSVENITGIIDHVSSRFAYLKQGEDEDIFIRGRDLNSATHGDNVEVQLLRRRHGAKREGRVVKILERARSEVVGKLLIQRDLAFVTPDNKKLHDDLFVTQAELHGARHNDKVIVRVIDWPGPRQKGEATVIRVLGPAGKNEAEIHSIMAEFELPFEFPEEVEMEASKIKDTIEDEIKNRRDIRQVPTFTIDPADAKDFDDALSFRKLENGHYEIGIHIADVTHYVKPGTVLEEEALHRATSVYLVDRTIPMLPEKLSNELCSLRPLEEKLTFSVIFELDDRAVVRGQWFGRTAIYSDRRFTYEEAQEVIESGKGDFSEEIAILNKLALKLKEKRFKDGAVNFETGEVKFRLDDDGIPLEVIPKIRKDAHKLIEEFMLLANRSVATFVYKRKKGEDKETFVYRTHDYPDPEKMSDFAAFASKFGHKVALEGRAISHSINKLLKAIEGQPEEHLLQTLAIRSMAKAKYTTSEQGHFGLAFKHYTHFTSPIRRYPDMMVHRLLQHYLNDGKSANKKDYEEKCQHSSEREKRAADAERASIKYKQVEYMSNAPDKVYEGLISGVTEWGIYVEIVENRCEGMIRLSDMDDDFYEFDERNYRVLGRSTGNEYTLGDEVKVKVKNTDIDKRIIDLVLVW